jgi:hypothetical protein
MATNFTVITVLHLWNSPLRMLKADITMSPATIAFVAAIAGIMLPAIANEDKAQSQFFF